MHHLPENQWYPVLQSTELKSRPLGVERFGQRLVFWRTADGQPHAHPDRGPHLGAALSAGTIVSDRLVCPFHGFEFDAGGVCQRIPANGCAGKVPKGMRVERFPLAEAHGFVWLWLGQAREHYPALPFFEQLASGWRYRTDVVDWPVHYTRAIENQLDVAHLAFVHRTTIGRGGRSFVDGPYVEAGPDGIRIWVTNAPDQGQARRSQAELAQAASGKAPSLHFRFPATWLLDIGPRLKNFIAFVPINDHTVRYYLRLYHRVSLPVVSHAFELVMGWSNRFVLNQDRRVVLTQTPASSLDAGGDRFIEADRGIIEYRKQLERLLRPDA
jgi:phenylpropionate dioxygenase-like ring-hydroxylating dioxygenase large terminal subunit